MARIHHGRRVSAAAGSQPPDRGACGHGLDHLVAYLREAVGDDGPARFAGEHRNEHQLATAAKFAGRPGLHIADEAGDVEPLIDRVLAGGEGGGSGDFSPYASPQLIDTLKTFINAKA